MTVAGIAGAQCVLFACIACLARAAGPAILGAFHYQVAIGTLGGTLLALRYELACTSDNPRAAFSALVNVLALATCIACAGLVLAPAVGLPSVGLFAAFAFATIVQQAANGFLTSMRRYAWISASRIATNAGFLAMLLAATDSVSGGSIDPFMLYTVSSILVALVTLMAIVRYGVTQGYAIRIARTFFIEHVRFPVYILPATLCGAVLTHALTLAIPNWFGDRDAGQFAAAYRLGFFPVALIGLGVGAVFRRDALAAIAAPDARRALSGMYASYARMLLALSLLYALVSAWAFRPLVMLFFGAVWQPSADLHLRLLPLFALQMSYIPLSQIFLARRAQRIDFLFQLVSGAVLLAALLIARRLGLSLLSSVTAFSLAGSAMMTAGLALTYRCAQHTHPCGEGK
ncbi:MULTISPECIES: translocase [Burkholderia]|uniref:translocase n=1 Tax=Burkholderia TaxID=32008 RepID=UPI00211B4A02|nr:MULTISPECIES: translocase [Burkholderia]